jgi:hypothetical protein
MEPQHTLPKRHIWFAIAGLVAMVVGMSAARTALWAGRW